MTANDRQNEGLGSDALGEESSEAFKASDFGKRLQRYSEAKERTYQFSVFASNRGRLDISVPLNRCGSFMIFHEYFRKNEIRLAQVCTCKKHLVCQLCAIRRGGKSVRVYSQKVQQLLSDDPSLKLYLVTFTIKNGHDLGERFRHLTSHLRAYHKRRLGTRQTGEVLKASAAVWSYEFTNIGNGWHPHCHALWLCHEPPDMYALRREWLELTGDSFMCHVKSVDTNEDPFGAFEEVFKYSVKFSGLPFDLLLHAYDTLRGFRLQGSFGLLRGLDVEISSSDSLLEDEPFIRRFFRFLPDIGYSEDYFKRKYFVDSTYYNEPSLEQK